MTTANRFHLVPPRTWDIIISSFSDVHLLALTATLRRLSRAGMGEVLRPREGERPYPKVQLHPNHRRSPPSDNHWSRLTHITHNLLDRLRRTAKTPLPKNRPHCRRPYSVGTQKVRRPDWVSGAGMDRAWPIVVHSRRAHKGVRYWLVTAG